MKRSSAPANRRRGLSPVQVGVLLVVLSLIGIFFAFSKRVPFKQHYEVNAVVQTSNMLAKGSVVRIAGIDVGKISALGRYKDTNLAQITMRITAKGRPIRRDATLKIRPRLFLEGNFFVDLEPGEPNSPEMPNNGTIPLTATAVPVQMDQFLSSLRSDTRTGLQETVKGLGDTLGSKPTATEDESQDLEVRGLTGGESLNRTLDTSVDSLRGGATVVQALRGQKPGDLSRALSGLGDITSELASAQPALVDLLTDFNTTLAATGDNAGSLTKTIQKLSVTSSRGRQTFADLRKAIPVVQNATGDLTDTMEITPAVVDASKPWLGQAKPLLSQRELAGLLDDLTPTMTNLAKLTRESRQNLVPATNAFSQCMNKVFLPTALIEVQDGALTNPVPNYKEFWYALPGLASGAAGFDGNGSMLRLQGAGGATPVKTGLGVFNNLPSFGNAVAPSTGTSPAFTGKEPVIRRDVACSKNPVPDINGPASKGPAEGSQPSAAAPPLPSANRSGSSE